MGKKILYALGFVLLIGGILGYNYYQKIFGEAITKDYVLFINSTDSLVDVKEKIADYSKNPNTFLWVAAKKNFSKPKTGRYLIKQGMSNNDLVNMLRSGNQTALKISFNNQDTLEKFAGRIAEQLELDSIAIINSFTEKEFLTKNKLNKKSVLQICIPNSYEFYWTVSADKFRNKLLREYNRFWNASRLAKAKALKLTKDDVITLASIVQKETAQKVERPIVAGLYLNRLKNGWPLQADPTIIYCIKEVKGQDYVVKRVLNVDLEINSPYNTYKNRGLPPTLISMPDISSIDGVLNAQKHDYFYMCVNVDKFGYHSFAKTLAQHNRNAAKYQNWLNKKGVNR
ncbi:aminodeoxychorismate lyase [Polaribacter reichenbachii]|uniref:Endolytic murein transglycosylase n=1 Tax=Polaribacter reichenbachii TaxID=996801 RepID=A0A1B8U5T3_9FLAO|nr:endolytic transglycosylase MltG [Polaribacter reichenbachii]APZ47833.1 aminodeoxychorismate lyase [Polaribacter reichenbachii]AUC18468.1 aminodeoxychorismate lyase [Polaribacter reichenbachii]OBY67219.1 aminodeoxychorismate lyase [Polaribacter reichenbachii]